MTTDREHIMRDLLDATSALSRLEGHWQSNDQDQDDGEDAATTSLVLTEHYPFKCDLAEVVSILQQAYIKLAALPKTPAHGSPGSRVYFICNGRVLSGVVMETDPRNTAYRNVEADGTVYRVHNCDLRPSTNKPQQEVG